MENQNHPDRIYFTIGYYEIRKPQLVKLVYTGFIMGLILGVWLVVN